MNSYEVLRPDGAGTDIWACGDCHKPHVVAGHANPTQTDWDELAVPGGNE
jgi:Zn-finger protein